MTTRDGRRFGVRGFGYVIIGLLKMVRFGGSFSIELCIYIHVCGSMILVVLKVPGYDLKCDCNFSQKEYFLG